MRHQGDGNCSRGAGIQCPPQSANGSGPDSSRSHVALGNGRPKDKPKNPSPERQRVVKIGPHTNGSSFSRLPDQ
jgi:hypothetical protein